MVFQQIAGAALLAAGTGMREVAGSQQESAIRRTSKRREGQMQGELQDRVGNREAELALLFDADQAQTQRLKELGLTLAGDQARTAGMEMFRDEAEGAQAALREMAPDAPSIASNGPVAGSGVAARAEEQFGGMQETQQQLQEQAAGQVASQEAAREAFRAAQLSAAQAPDVAAARVMFQQDRMRMSAEQHEAAIEFENDLRQAAKRGAILNAFGGLAQQVGGGLLGGGMGK